MSVKEESLEMKKMMVWDSYLKARGRNTTSFHFPFGKQSLGPRKRFKEEEEDKKSKALTFDNTAERNDHNSESDGDKQNLHRLLNS